MTLHCPVARCGAENAPPISECVSCGADLRAYAAARAFHDVCYNQALRLARAGEYAEALRRLAGGLALCPQDDEARMLEADIVAALPDKSRARSLWKWLSENGQDENIRQRAKSRLHTPPRSKKAPSKKTSRSARTRRRRRKKK